MPEFGDHVPRRNRNFVGRSAELAELTRRLIEPADVTAARPPQPIVGTGGMGKTAISVEYAHSAAHNYDIIWWISAQDRTSVVAGLIRLGQRLGLPVEEDQEAVPAVHRALLSGQPRARWLLIFDDATPDSLGTLVPRTTATGHVIITSQATNWDSAVFAEPVVMNKFTMEESLSFLRGRAKALAPVPDDGGPGAAEREATRAKEAMRLAEAVDHLPLLEDHAAAYLNETGVSVERYLDFFASQPFRLLSADATIPYQRTAAAAWSMAIDSLREPERALFRLCTYFSPEGIGRELLNASRGDTSLPPELHRVLADSHEFLEAIRRVARFSLVGIDAMRNTIEMHGVVQKVARDLFEQQEPDQARAYRQAAHLLLASSDPGSPEREDYDAAYELSLPHLRPSGALDSTDPAVRSLIINQVIRLRRRGGHTQSAALAEDALARWRRSGDDDDLSTLMLATQLGIVWRLIGRSAEAAELTEATLARLRASVGPRHPATLVCANSHGADLRHQNRFAESLQHDLEQLRLYEEVHSADHPQTFRVINNIAADYRRLGDYQRAYDHDMRAWEGRNRLRPGGMDALNSLSSVGHDLRELGRYEESLQAARDAAAAFEALRGPDNVSRLDALKRFAVALRRIGSYADARRVAEDAHRRFVLHDGETHRYTLTAATVLVSDRRLAGDLRGAFELGERTLAALRESAPGQSICHAAQVNFAIACRRLDRHTQARELDSAAVAGLTGLLGESHLFTLCAMTNLASDHAAVGELAQSREIGRRALMLARDAYGPDHPVSLAAAANLSIDLRAGGDEEAGPLLDDTLDRYHRTLGDGHPEARRAAERGRIDVDIEPF